MRIWTDYDRHIQIASDLTPEYRTWAEGVKDAIAGAIKGRSTGNTPLGGTMKVPFMPPLKPLLMSDPVPPFGISTGFGIATIENFEARFTLTKVEMPFGYDPTC